MKTVLLPILFASFLLVCSALAQEATKQALCPLMVDDEIDLEEFVVFKGVKVFMCCGSCKEMWDKNREYFAVVCQEQAPQLKAVASKKIKLLKQLCCPVYANVRVHPKSLSVKHDGKTIYLSKKRAVARFQEVPQEHAVRFPKVMSCNNMKNPLGMGLWEGVPLRNVIWLAKPTHNVRRGFYYGHHNEDPKQMFRSSLPIGRALEDPPDNNPIILCYKLNGEWLSGKRGGPVRMLVPDAYGFKSVKWLKTVALTNDHTRPTTPTLVATTTSPAG